PGVVWLVEGGHPDDSPYAPRATCGTSRGWRDRGARHPRPDPRRARDPVLVLRRGDRGLRHRLRDVGHGPEGPAWAPPPPPRPALRPAAPHGPALRRGGGPATD